VVTIHIAMIGIKELRGQKFQENILDNVLSKLLESKEEINFVRFTLSKTMDSISSFELHSPHNVTCSLNVIF